MELKRAAAVCDLNDRLDWRHTVISTSLGWGQSGVAPGRWKEYSVAKLPGLLMPRLTALKNPNPSKVLILLCAAVAETLRSSAAFRALKYHDPFVEPF